MSHSGDIVVTERQRIVPYQRIVHETEKAVLLECDGKNVWFPKSVCTLLTVAIVPRMMRDKAGVPIVYEGIDERNEHENRILEAWGDVPHIL